MDLCEDCARKKKEDDIFQAMNALEEALHPLRDVCDIIEGMTMETPPPPYLYRRVTEHTQEVTERFYAAWHVLFDSKAVPETGGR